MWLGLLYPSPVDTNAYGDEQAVLLLAWEAGRDRPLTLGGPISAVAEMARVLRAGARQTPLGKPRCDACGTPLDLPLD